MSNTKKILSWSGLFLAYFTLVTFMGMGLAYAIGFAALMTYMNSSIIYRWPNWK